MTFTGFGSYHKDSYDKRGVALNGHPTFSPCFEPAAKTSCQKDLGLAFFRKSAKIIC